MYFLSVLKSSFNLKISQLSKSPLAYHLFLAHTEFSHFTLRSVLNFVSPTLAISVKKNQNLENSLLLEKSLLTTSFRHCAARLESQRLMQNRICSVPALRLLLHNHLIEKIYRYNKRKVPTMRLLGRYYSWTLGVVPASIDFGTVFLAHSFTRSVQSNFPVIKMAS